MGESAYLRRTPDERLAELVAQDIIDLVSATTRRIEKMTSDLLFTGKISYLLDDNSTEVLDYGTVTPIVPSVLWDATTGSDPIKHLSNAASTIIANSCLVPDTVVMGEAALSAFLNNAVGAIEQVALGRRRNLADRSTRGRHRATHRNALSAVREHLRVQRDVRGRGVQRAEADDRPEGGLARVQQVAGRDQLRQRDP